MIGGTGLDRIVADLGEDILIGSRSADDVDFLDVMDSLYGLQDGWNGSGSFADRVDALQNDIDSLFTDDGDPDTLTGASGEDWFVAGVGDKVTDSSSGNGGGGNGGGGNGEDAGDDGSGGDTGNGGNGGGDGGGNGGGNGNGGGKGKKKVAVHCRTRNGLGRLWEM